MNATGFRLSFPPTLPPARAWLPSVAGLAAAAAAGAAVGRGRTEVAVVVVGAVVALLAPSLTLAQWVGLLLLSSVAGRAVAAAGLPSVTAFLHYPIAVGFAASAALQRRSPDGGAARRVGRWLAGLLALSAAAMAGNDSHPVRAALFLLIVSQPLLVLWAVLRWPADPTVRRRVGVLAVALLALQVPIGLVQGLTVGWLDSVQGTFIGSGNGAHQLGALLALGLLVAAAAVLAGRLSRRAGVAIGAGAIGMIVAAGANQVMLAVAPGLVCIPLLLLGRRRQGAGNRTRLAVGGALLTVLLTVAGVALMQRADGSDILGRSRKLVSAGQLAEVQLLRDRSVTDPGELVLGSGPGTTASRASLLLTPAMMKQSSPLAALRLPPTEAGVKLAGMTQSRYGGSAEALASGTLGMAGDLGLLGLAGLVAVHAGLWRMLGRSGDWLAPAAKAALLMTGVLLLIDNWLEYPEFAVPLALLVGFGLRPAATAEPAEGAEGAS